MALGKRIKQQRTKLGMTQHELGEMIGKSQAYIYMLESRDSKKTDSSFEIAKALGVSHDWLIMGGDIKLVSTSDAPYSPTLDLNAVEWAIIFIDKHITEEMMTVRTEKWKARIFAALYDLYLQDQTVKTLKDETVLRLIQL